MRRYLAAYPIKSFAFLLAILQLGLLGLYFFQLQNGIDFKGHLVGRDFVNMYLGGGLIGQGQVDILFSQEGYWDALRDWLGDDYLIHNWSYPPTMFWLAELLAKLPYYLAYFVWTFGGVLVLGFALRTLGLSWLWAMAVVLSPAGFWNILAGQNAFYISGFLIFALGASWGNKKLPAGLFWALATVKPHLGLLVRAWPDKVADKRYWISWFAIGSYLLLPYSFMYDFMLFQVILLMWRDDLTELFKVKNEEMAQGIWIFLWMSPLIFVAVVAITKIQFMPLVLLWLLWNLGSKDAGRDEVIDTN